MKIVSITIRGFQATADEICGQLGGKHTLAGDAGKPYRERQETILRKSFIVNEMTAPDDAKIENLIKDLIAEWGEVPNINRVRSKYDIEQIYINIVLECNDDVDSNRLLFSAASLKDVAELGAELLVTAKTNT